jgi:hypothetical protein
MNKLNSLSYCSMFNPIQRRIKHVNNIIEIKNKEINKLLIL